jgi:hypothetical protein
MAASVVQSLVVEAYYAWDCKMLDSDSKARVAMMFRME